MRIETNLSSFVISKYFLYICIMEIKILFLMILLHIIDDFHLQGILGQMKQKNWWLKQKGYKDMYENDYQTALTIHSLSWSIFIMLPFLFITPPINPILLTFIISANTVVHCYVDDLKCNQMKINLASDQVIHFLQILITWLICI